MDLVKKLTDFVMRHRYAVLILAVGIILMLLPTGEKKVSETVEETIPEISLSEQLEQILSQIDGVGKVQVLLTVASGEEIIYQYDDKTVTVTDAERAENGLIRQVIPERYLGAVVVCQGADQASVRLCVVEAVCIVTGLNANCVTVVKMK